jgi:hypothetical protein
VNGKALAQSGKLLDALAKQEGVPRLMEFFGVSPEEVAALGLNLKREPEPETWFAAEDGLKTVRTLLRKAETEGLGKRIASDLKEFEIVLSAAERAGVRWHLAVDY